MVAGGRIFLASSAKVGVQKSPSGEVPHLKSSLWSDWGFAIIKIIGSHIPFFKEFPGDYKALNIKSFS